jgi:hypothetical protein
MSTHFLHNIYTRCILPAVHHAAVRSRIKLIVSALSSTTGSHYSPLREWSVVSRLRAMPELCNFSEFTFTWEAFGWQGREDCVDLYILPLSLSLNMPIAEKPLLNSRISLDLPQGVDPTKTIPAFGDRAIPRVVSEPSPSPSVSLSRTVEPLCQPYSTVVYPSPLLGLSCRAMAWPEPARTVYNRRAAQ